MKKLIIILIFSCVNASCGKEEKKKTTFRETPISESQIQSIMANQFIDCDMIGGGHCPQGIARLFTINKKNPSKSNVCSGFMVGPKTLVTNHHCVPNKMACQNTYMAVYEGSFNRYLSTRCKKILATKEDYPTTDSRKKIDVTIMEIESEYMGDFFELKEDNLSFGDRARAVVVDHTGLDSFNKNLSESRITEFHCEYEDWALSSSMVLKRCPVIGGNSGSPLLNDEGKVIGIIWGSRGNINGRLTSSTSLSSRRMDTMAGALVTPAYYIKKLFR